MSRPWTREVRGCEKVGPEGKGPREYWKRKDGQCGANKVWKSERERDQEVCPACSANTSQGLATLFFKFT